MKVEIEVKKEDLRRIFYAALRYYYHDLQSRVGEDDPDGSLYSGIADNLCEIRGACDTISHLCDLIDEIDAIDYNDATGKIVFDPTADEE